MTAAAPAVPCSHPPERSKQAVDAFFMRAGGVLSAGLVFPGERLAFVVPVF